jgi:hypothetical protein
MHFADFHLLYKKMGVHQCKPNYCRPYFSYMCRDQEADVCQIERRRRDPMWYSSKHASLAERQQRDLA